MTGRLAFECLSATALSVCVALEYAPAARADTVYPLSVCKASSGCPAYAPTPYGTVTVSQFVDPIAHTVNPMEIAITTALGSDQFGQSVFSFGGAGRPLAFDLSLTGNPTVTASNLPSGWSFSASMVQMLDGSGNWADSVNCATCSGTSGHVTGPITFDLSVSSGSISPSSFAQNNKNFYFVSDIGIATGSTTFSTGDVTSPNFSAVPLPAAFWLLLGGLGGPRALTRQRKAAAA
jgi:hypothetical protein